MTTREVIQGAPILGVDFSLEEWRGDSGPEGFGSGGGEFSGWTFVHTHDTVPEHADLYFFGSIAEVDEAVKTLIDAGDSGTWSRESEFAPFEALEEE